MWMRANIRVHTCVDVCVLSSCEPDATTLSQSPVFLSAALGDPLQGRTPAGLWTSTHRFSAAAFVSLGALWKHTRLLVTVRKLRGRMCCHPEAPCSDPSESLNQPAEVAIPAHSS